MKFPPRMRDLVLENLREIPDFPRKGVLFRDITPLLANGPAFKELITLMAEHYRGKIDAVAGLESRGFILAAPLVVELGIGMMTVRKGGKLPGPVIGVDYDLEYGSARMEIRPDSVPEGARVLILDDVLATGGTARAAMQLIDRSGGSVAEIAVLMELEELGGRKVIGDVPFQSLVTF
ncbi:adenine phosphoribosyltransferase [Actinomyces sp. HMSC064C12]|nr:adenine phosphoribosyltransferase [Actinomyces sp. HMSC064C12]